MNPWAAGAVVFDNRPYMAFFERQMTRQQAKTDALDNYFRDLNKNVTPTGMRSQDIDGLLQKNKEWQQFYSQNKAAILNPKLDNGRAYNQYMSGYQDQLGLVSQSKEALKTMDEVGKLRLNPQTAYIGDDPALIDEIKSHELPIGHPDRRGINMATLTLPPKPIETKDWDAYNKYLVGGVPHDKILGDPEDIGGFKTKTPVYTQYSPENQKVIGQHAMNAYDTDKRWRLAAQKYFNDVTNDPTLYDQLNKVYKPLYGNDIDSPKEAWAAKGILDNNLKATEYKEGRDDLGRDLFMQKIKQANAKELIRYKKSIDPSDADVNNVWYQTYLDNVMNDAKAGGELRHMYTSDGKSLGYFNMVNPDPFLMKAFARRNTEPDKLGVTRDGKIIPIFYKYTKEGVVKDAKGNPVIDQDDSRPLTYDQALVNLGYRGATKKQLGKDMTQAQSAPKSINRKYSYDGRQLTHKELNDAGYTDSEIEDYIKKGIIK